MNLAERLRRFDELVVAGSHGVKDVGWPTNTWGMITTFHRMHQLFEEVMERPVYTHEMGTVGLAWMRQELEEKTAPVDPITSMLHVVEGKKP